MDRDAEPTAESGAVWLDRARADAAAASHEDLNAAPDAWAMDPGAGDEAVRNAAREQLRSELAGAGLVDELVAERRAAAAAEDADAWLAWSRGEADEHTPPPPRTWVAHVTRDPEDAAWWLVVVAGVGMTQVRDPADAVSAATELVVVTLDIDPAAVRVLAVPDPGGEADR